MKLLGLKVKNFRVFEEGEFVFEPGLNIIVGPNESGKSSLILALLAGLFEKPHASNVRSRSNRRWGAASAPLIELEFTHGGSTYVLVKDFEARTVLLTEVEKGTSTTSFKAVEAKISEFTGFSEPVAYLRTACVTHEQVVSLSPDRVTAQRLAAMLRETVVGCRDSVSVVRSLAWLDKRIEELRRGLEHPTKKPGVIRRLADERELLIARQKEVARGASGIESKRKRLEEVAELLEEKKTRLFDIEELLSKNERILDLEKRKKQAAERYQEAERIRLLSEDLRDRRSELERDYPGFEDLGPQADAELRREMEIRGRLSSLREELSTGREKEEGPKRGPGWAALFAGVALAALGGFLGTLSPWLFSLFGAGLFLVAVGVWLLFRASKTPAGDYLLADRLQRTDREIAKLEAKEREFLESIGCRGADEFFRKYDSFRELKKKRDVLASALSAVLGERDPAQVEEQRKLVALEVSACEAGLEELSGYRLTAERLQELSREREMLAEEVDSLKREKGALAYHLEQAADDPEELLRIEETLSGLWDEEQAARRRLRVYTLARDAMERTSASMLRSAVPVLAEAVGRTLSSLTGKRYDRVEIDESDLSISVYSRDKAALIPADEVIGSLSMGTRSQLYLAARIELVEVLSSGIKPPLLFDDSFVYFDEERLKSLMEVLREVSRDQQVLIFTCTGRFDRLAGESVNRINLGRE